MCGISKSSFSAPQHFSSCPSDSTLRWTPCPPEYGKQRLQVRLGYIQLSLSCPFRRLHTFCFLRPARLLPPTFGYGAPHLSARGTLTLQNNALLSTHFRVADNPGVISHGTPIRDTRCDHFYGKRVFVQVDCFRAGSSCALSLTRMDEASNWARAARRYYYEAFRTATEIREGQAAFPAGTFLLAEGADAAPRALIPPAKVQRYIAA